MGTVSDDWAFAGKRLAKAERSVLAIGSVGGSHVSFRSVKYSA